MRLTGNTNTDVISEMHRRNTLKAALKFKVGLTRLKASLQSLPDVLHSVHSSSKPRSAESDLEVDRECELMAERVEKVILKLSPSC